MSRLRVHSFSISLDGYRAGPDQGPENPIGLGGLALHEWRTRTRTFRRALGDEDGAAGTDDDIEARGSVHIGAWILGRNMFGPIRGEWLDEQWKGWWGANPPYHTDVFVLTHHARRPLEMEGGTTFHFVTDGIHTALERATAAAKGRDVRLGGGIGTIRQYLQARLIDEMHIAIAPVIVGKGEHLLGGIDVPALGYACAEHITTAHATHFVLKKKA